MLNISFVLFGIFNFLNYLWPLSKKRRKNALIWTGMLNNKNNSAGPIGYIILRDSVKVLTSKIDGKNVIFFLCKWVVIMK